VIALDTSVAVPLLMETHEQHADVVVWRADREICLCGHALVETYSVLTRLPGDLRAAPADVARVLRERFAPPIALAEATAARLPELLAELGVRGGAVYDAMVALTAFQHDVALASRDARARTTYEAVGARVVTVA
jgi:toxin FitB